MPAADSHPTLCERCGYEIGGLPDAGACPECARPIADSAPERRVGSAWQRSPGLLSPLVSIAATLRWPMRSWNTVTADISSSSALLWINCTLAALIFPGGALIWISHSKLDAAMLAPIAVGVWTGALLALSWIESRGIRIIGRFRRFRITRAVAYAVVGHAAAGWVVGAIAGTITTAIIAREDYIEAKLNGVGVGAAVAAGVGLVFFEILTYIGMRRMKFANHPRSAPMTESATV